jgi:hypothetical protein
LASLWLLRTAGPIQLRKRHEADGTQPQPAVECACGEQRDWLIVVDGPRITLICRCGRRQELPGVALEDIVALVVAEPLQPQWSDLDDALRALGFAARERPGRPGLGASPAQRSWLPNTRQHH